MAAQYSRSGHRKADSWLRGGASRGAGRKGKGGRNCDSEWRALLSWSMGRVLLIGAKMPPGPATNGTRTRAVAKTRATAPRRCV